MNTSLAVYIHWPFCKSKCPYCDFNSHVRESVDQAAWRAALLSELQYMHSHLPDRKVTSIFFGGGTPSLMPPQTAQAVIDKVHALWPVADHIEITLEANPTSVEINTFPHFKAAGVNRVSLGVQSFDDKELKFLGRGHSSDEARRAIDRARATFDRYSFDLIYARPGQNVALWEKELGEALHYAGSHLSLYQLTIEENTAFHHAYKKGEFALPKEEESEALYLLTEEILKVHGLLAYEVSNYAKPGEESRHNLSYWKGDDYIGVGPGAHGRVTKNGARHATQTLKSPERWLENVAKQGHAVEVWQETDEKTEMEERVMMGLRLTEGVEAAMLLPVINAKKRALFTAEGLLTNDPERLCATLKGRLVLNQLTTELLL
jgi:putative oxygen-independent coproporphyrinogen III oxidase